MTDEHDDQPDDDAPGGESGGNEGGGMGAVHMPLPRLNPAFALQMRSLSLDVSDMVAAVNATLAVSAPSWEAINQIVSQTRMATAAWQEVVAATRAHLRRFDWDSISSALDQMLPPNLRGQPRPFDLTKAVDFVEAEGIPLAYVPRADIGGALVAGSTREDREQVLTERREHIVEDCRRALADLASSDVDDLVTLASRAVDALADGHHEAAQALAATVLDSTISRMIPEGGTRKPLTRSKPGTSAPPEVAEIRRLIDLMVWYPVYNSHGEFWPGHGDPIPTVYSRHATVHAAGAVQYRTANAVQAVLVVTSLLCHAATRGLRAPERAQK